MTTPSRPWRTVKVWRLDAKVHAWLPFDQQRIGVTPLCQHEGLHHGLARGKGWS